ncbi:Uncharacterised protein [Clostridium putrefaciens]|uniref:Uncharacterized protein n=1 Tax=Clostridium putrefaciens TaxID=99675 RepID=A0A381J865_9CLOT|nr:hypothetical protein [Clostridium putrefaciens]SUY47464.1 Uncharacterised protein [Clostridium putrefaciens]
MPIYLMIIAGVLITLNIRAIKKEDKSFKEVLIQKENSITPTDIAIGKMRKDMAESIFELQKDIEYLKNNMIMHDKQEDVRYNSIINNDLVKSEQKPQIINLVKDDEIKNVEEIKESDKVIEVIKLFSNGKEVEEICEELNLNRGEVLLIKELYKK